MQKYMKRAFVAASVAVLLSLSCGPVHAQRTMKGQYLSEASALWGGSVPGGQVFFGQYLQNSLWKAGITFRSYSKTLSTSDLLQYADICAEGEWRYRLLSTRSRMLSLYGGGGVQLGYEMYDPWRTLPDVIDTGLGKGSFMYGISAGVDAELFFTRRLALVAGARVPLNFSSKVDWFHWEISAGLRFNL